MGISNRLQVDDDYTCLNISGNVVTALILVYSSPIMSNVAQEAKIEGRPVRLVVIFVIKIMDVQCLLYIHNTNDQYYSRPEAHSLRVYL